MATLPVQVSAPPEVVVATAWYCALKMVGLTGAVEVIVTVGFVLTKKLCWTVGAAL